MPKKIDIASATKLAEEWDLLAPIRYKQIMDGKDITFTHFLAPNMIELVQKARGRTAIDAGCGVGILTNMLSSHVAEIIGIDPSRTSIQIAKINSRNNTKFYNNTIEEYTKVNQIECDIVVANMVLMDAPNISSFIASVSKLLHAEGTFIFSITHPCFWPRYYGYESAPWFNYGEEIVVESNFRISTERYRKRRSTHIHRPIHLYVENLYKSGFIIQDMMEPMPSPSVAELYPKPWKYPRYLFMVCKKT